MAASSILLDRFGRPLEIAKRNGKPRPWPLAPVKAVNVRHSREPDIKARYDLAQTDNENAKHWGAADSYDADSANSQAIRRLLVGRSRLEASNNGYVDGLQKTDATFVVRTGPRLRLDAVAYGQEPEQTATNDKVKRDWHRWCAAIQLRRKLWCMAHARVQDGESFAVVRYNPNLADPVKLDMCLFETEQCQTPYLPMGVVGYVDGIRFDPWGNPIYYDILPTHPGATGIQNTIQPDHVPAKYILHWYLMERPGQHRGIPAFTSTLGLGAVGRRWREAVVAGAETIADIAGIAYTQGAPDDGADEFAPFGTVEIQKRMMMMLPMGWDFKQPRGEQPPATYEMFVRSNISEIARPRSMPYNLAMADSSSHSFASGKLDTIPYYMVIDDLDREDCNDLVLNKLFVLWWHEYVLLKHSKGEMWEADPDVPPEHTWDWKRNPVADMASEVRTNTERMRTGQASPSDIAHENGQSFEDMVRKFARDLWGDEKPESIKAARTAIRDATIAPVSGGTLEMDGGGGGAQGESQPELNKAAPIPNGDDVPNMEQMSMLVAELKA